LGKWGQLDVRVFVTIYFTIKSNYPNPQIRNTYKNYTSYKMRYTRYKQFKIYKIHTDSHPRAKHAPSGFYPTWTAFTGNLPTQALKDETSDASPSGILKHLLIHTTTMIISMRYSNDHQIITTS
jgi:hypothetical protein